MPENSRMMYPHLDRFQHMKRSRMKFLLEEIEQRKEIPLKEFLSSIAVQYGIRRITALEYINDWIDGGFIVVQENNIRFLKKPEGW